MSNAWRATTVPPVGPFAYSVWSAIWLLAWRGMMTSFRMPSDFVHRERGRITYANKRVTTPLIVQTSMASQAGGEPVITAVTNTDEAAKKSQ